MPKYGIHYIVLQKVAGRLQESNDEAVQDLGRILRENRFAASIGCVGPDLLFWAPDYAVVEVLADFVKVYDELKQRWEVLEEFAEAIEQNIEEGVDAVIAALEPIPIIGPLIATAQEYGEAFEEIKSGFERLADAFKDESRQALLIKVLGLDSAAGSDGLTLARSLFHGLFQSKQQAGRDEMDWYWFEMLHYRNTGDFVKALIRNAEATQDEEQMAYAYAYATHYATDLVGHPFVNTISGSPYRMNVQRHVVIENFMDQWAWRREFPGANIRNDLFSRLGLEESLPRSIARLISQTLKDVYSEVAHPLRYVVDTDALAQEVGVRNDRDGFLEPDDIQTALVFQKLILEFLGGQEQMLRPEEPYPGADGDLADLVNDGGVNLPPPPPPPGAELPSTAAELLVAIDEWLGAVSQYVAQLLDAAKEAMDETVDALEDFLEDPADELMRRIQLWSYAIRSMIYDVYRMIHQVLALAGLAYPEPDDTNLTSPTAESLITTRQVSYKDFPILRTPGQPHLDTRSYVPFMTNRTHDAFPYQSFENPSTVASHYANENVDTPDGFIDGVPLDVDLLRQYAEAVRPADTRRLQDENRRSFGNAVDLSRFILENRNQARLEHVVFCNWNLDGDRGYGYKCWEGVPFTVWRGEMDGAIAGNEPLEEVRQQNFSVWTRATEGIENGNPTTEYDSEGYVGNKLLGRGLLSPLNISDNYIPSMFTHPDGMGGVPRSAWINLVPRRFQIRTGTTFNNIFFCNGATTTPSSGIRVTMALQKTLNAAFQGIATDLFRLKHIHNYSSPEWGDLFMLSDLIEAVPGDYLGSMQNSDDIAAGDPLREFTNPTQVAVIALLHHGMDQDIPLILSGHSQGTMITANAVMVFSTIGNAHRDYLRQRVKLFHMEPELIVGTRNLLRDLVKSYLVYIMNVADPEGTDLLVEATSGLMPGIPGQPGGLVAAGSGMAALRNLLANPNPFDINFYLELENVMDEASDDLTELIRYRRTISMDAHYMPVQLLVLAADITNNRFRTDPGTLDNQTVQLSTDAPAPNGTSVRVRDFFMTP